ncbi:MAG: ribonuclease HIII [Firmicutes bacterium]|nr:ribonuclease HIII [Bacillota bacterium]
MNCIVFKLSDNLKNKFIKFYEPFKCEKNPPYSVFQAKNYDVTITLYESGKVMFQGIGADIEASIWIDAERRLNGKTITTDQKKEKKEVEKEENFFLYSSTIGSDETGCGDAFGPVVVAATYVSKENIEFLKSLGVKDSKQINDDKIKQIAPEIIKNIPYVCFILNNKTYNENYQNINMVKLKCILHNKVLCSLIEKYQPVYTHCVVDQFVNEKKYYEYLADVPKKVTNISFYTKGESKCMAVAAASIIARYTFLSQMQKLENEYGYLLPKGAGSVVDEQIKKIIQEKGKDYLTNFAKLNFKNFTK